MQYSLEGYKNNNIKRAEGRGRKAERGRKRTMSTFPLQASNPEVGRAGRKKKFQLWISVEFY